MRLATRSQISNLEVYQKAVWLDIQRRLLNPQLMKTI